MMREDVAALERAERRLSDLTEELRERSRAGRQDGALVGEWVRANHAFHDVIHECANAPFVTRLAKGARRTFFGQAVWAAGSDIDELYERNDRQHTAIRQAVAAGSAEGARALAREHVLSSGHMLEAILDQVEPRAASGRRARVG
jgi:DNA-binding GntR family transcriptional regulator